METYSYIMFYLTLTCQICIIVGQTVDLEQECNILKSLDTLSSKVEQLESLVLKVEQLQTVSTKVERLENIAKTTENQIKDMTQNSGSTYTRWGRTSCPGNGSDLVYSGYAGGSHYAHSGAAVDYLCLPKDPIFDRYEDTLQYGGLVYGAEYEFDDRSDPMLFFPGIGRSVQLKNRNVPCAVCRTTRTSVIMVPARNACHDGWTLEYKGYLSSGEYTHGAASQYVCLDDHPEYLFGDTGDQNGKLFYFVEGRCGSLKCPPYVNGRELTCAVCSK